MKHTILFLAANPLGTDRLALDRQAQAIDVELARSGFRDNFELVTRWAAEPIDLLRELRRLQPTVLHFSGHGSPVIPGHASQHGLYFQGPDGRPKLVTIAALDEALDAAGSSVKLVVLNACYSEPQAAALLNRVDCVVGLSGAIRDEAARSFAIGFYGGLGERQSIAAAYKQGCAAIALDGLAEEERPQLKTAPGIDAARLILASDPQDSQPCGLPARAMRIFLSYHPQGDDSHLAIRLHRELSRQGHIVSTETDMVVRSDKTSEPQPNLDDSDLLIVLITKESITSEVIQEQVESASRAYRRRGRPRILPVRARYDGRLDYGIERYIAHLHGVLGNHHDEDDLVLDHIEQTVSGVLASTSPLFAGRSMTTATAPQDGRPTPVMDLRVLACPGGTMAIHDPLYVRRSCDDAVDAFARVEDAQTLIIKGARQRGKSSLLVRYLAARCRSKKKVALIDFQAFSGVDLESYAEFLTSLAAAVLDVLEICAPRPMIQHQHEMTSFLRKTVLEASGPLVLAFDEVDRTASRSYQTDFWSMLRHWHNLRAYPSSAMWGHLDLVLAISTEPEFLIEDAYQSPFNVGQVIEVSSLSRDQCHELNSRYEPMRLQYEEVDAIYELVGGHPYLTRLACYRALTGELQFPLDMRTVAEPYGPFGDHLRALFNKMSRRPALLVALRQIIQGRGAESDSIHRLRSAGLVRLDAGVPAPANSLYTAFFRDAR